MVETASLLPVAEVLKLFGNNGILIVRFRSNARNFFQETEPLFAIMDGIAVPLFIATFQSHGNDRAHILFDYIYCETQALELIGKTLYQSASKHQDNKREQQDPTLLIGFTVSDTRQGPLGHVKAFMDWRLNPCVSIQCNHSAKTFLVPFQEVFISDIDLKTKHITMSLPEGLVEVNGNRL